MKLLQTFGMGGTTLPGLWIEKYMPSLVANYAKHYHKIVFTTGTNGKTTTQSALATILSDAGFKVVGNMSGSNMLRGIATTLLTAGIPRSPKTVLLCEVEEATMPFLTTLAQPDIILITNMYRDQLDAYGELDKTAEYIQKACLNCPNALLVLNNDDPIVSSLSEALPHKKLTFSLGEDAAEFQYEGAKRNVHKSDLLVRSIIVNEDLSTLSDVDIVGNRVTLTFRPPGKYNVYNALGACAAAHALGVSNESIISALAKVEPPFGRGETVDIRAQGKMLTFQIFLVKNPAGFSQVWNMLIDTTKATNLILGLNDNIADGRDVSWIWDIILQHFTRSDIPQLISCTGTRAYDMALRLKYADIGGTSQHITPDISACLDNMIQKSADGRRCFVLMTYTAMNQFRVALSRYTNLSPYSL